MGWGVNDYPQPREGEYFICENAHCEAHIDDEEDLAPGCEVAGCHYGVLCNGCSFDCADCNKSLCFAHVCETPLPADAERFAIYRCPECQGKVDRAEWLATRKPPVQELEAMSPAGWVLAR